MTNTAPASIRTNAVSQHRRVHPLVLPVTIGAQFVLPLSLAGTAVALPPIARDLGADSQQLQLVVNGFNLCFALFTIVWGRASSRLGYRTAFQLGVLLALIGSIASTVAPSLLILDIARLVAGIGAASVLTMAAAILSDTYEGAARTRAFTAFGTVSGFGMAAGPLVAGATVATFGWRAVFGLHAVLLLLALLGSVFLPPGKHHTGEPVRLFDPRVFKNAAFMRMALVPVSGAIGFVALLTYLPSAFEAIYGWTDGSAGIFMMAMTIPVFLSPLVSHRLITKRRVSATQLASIALGCLVLGPLGLLLIHPAMTPWVAAVPMILCGLGFGIPLGFVDGVALDQVPAELAGAAAGIFNLLRIGSEAVFVAAYGAAMSALIAARVADRVLGDRIAAGLSGYADDFVASQVPVLVIVAALCAAIAVAFVALGRRVHPTPEERTAADHH